MFVDRTADGSRVHRQPDARSIGSLHAHDLFVNLHAIALRAHDWMHLARQRRTSGIHGIPRRIHRRATEELIGREAQNALGARITADDATGLVLNHHTFRHRIDHGPCARFAQRQLTLGQPCRADVVLMSCSMTETVVTRPSGDRCVWSVSTMLCRAKASAS